MLNYPLNVKIIMKKKKNGCVVVVRSGQREVSGPKRITRLDMLFYYFQKNKLNQGYINLFCSLYEIHCYQKAVIVSPSCSVNYSMANLFP
jgi:hypothetical protein